MICVELEAHPTTPSANVHAIRVTLDSVDDYLVITYELHADMAFIELPEPAAAVHTDELWKQTCFELFLADDFGPGYQEFNFSPSGAWAHYHFSDYRRTSGTDLNPVTPVIRSSGNDEVFVLSAQIPNIAGSLGLSAVIKNSSGHISYWALAHPDGQPDFHHPDAFTLKL